ncbi:MAG: hypothetical protein IT290_01025 [Deltaproteobacteria bacterium]|nr:hypothetical protein [Deltaproteobacteria bacterium]
MDTPKATRQVCYRCSRELHYDKINVGRRDTCDGCGFDVHVCKNCLHYDASVYNECREPQADRVVDKEKSNFCDYFKLTGGADARSGSASHSKADALKALDDLFKK